jgi:hypothetical protein
MACGTGGVGNIKIVVPFDIHEAKTFRNKADRRTLIMKVTCTREPHAHRSLVIVGGYSVHHLAAGRDLCGDMGSSLVLDLHQWR